MAYDLAELFKCGGRGWNEETLDMQQGGEWVVMTMMKSKKAGNNFFFYIFKCLLPSRHGWDDILLTACVCVRVWRRIRDMCFYCIIDKNKKCVWVNLSLWTLSHYFGLFFFILLYILCRMQHLLSPKNTFWHEGSLCQEGQTGNTHKSLCLSKCVHMCVWVCFSLTLEMVRGMLKSFPPCSLKPHGAGPLRVTL